MRRSASLATAIAAVIAAVMSLLGVLAADPGIARAAGAVAPPTDPNTVTVLQTSAPLKEQLATLPNLQFIVGPPPNPLPVISINDAVAYQTVNGFGAAMTDSSAWLIEHALPAAARQTLMGELFGSTGIHLDFVRVPVGGSDYTVGGRPYTYDDLPAGRQDPTLAHFSIRHDKAYILPALRLVRALDPSAELLASPWTPPAWMKANDSLGNADNGGTLLPADYGPWAKYIIKFLQAYAAAGVPISAVTPQNEPGNATRYPGLNISAASLAAWTDDDLVPALRAARLPVGVFGNDYGWGAPTFADQLVADQAAAGQPADLAGIAWHCYYGSPDVMDAFHARAPRLPEIVDECSPGITPIPTSEVVIGSLRNWASTVALWNLALDPDGGPVELPNTGCPRCYGLATIDEETGSASLTSAYYDLGQASLAIEPGARRVASNNFVTYDYLRPGVNFVTPSLDDVALVNPDGSRVLITYNNGTAPVTFAVAWHGEFFDDTLPAGATATFEWDR